MSHTCRNIKVSLKKGTGLSVLWWPTCSVSQLLKKLKEIFLIFALKRFSEETFPLPHWVVQYFVSSRHQYVRCILEKQNVTVD